MKTKQRWVFINLNFAFVFCALLTTAFLTHAHESALRAVDQMVLQDYQKIQQALAADTLKPVATHAKSISKIVRNDQEKRLPVSLADDADKLSKDTDIKAARENFKAVSATIIGYLQKANVKGTGYQENYCAMAKASWIEKGKKINNPYYGKEMLECGEAKREF